MQHQALDRFGTAYGICNPLYGVQMVFSEDMADAFCRALNDWLVKEWLDKDDRLRGSIVIPVQSIEKALRLSLKSVNLIGLRFKSPSIPLFQSGRQDANQYANLDITICDIKLG